MTLISFPPVSQAPSRIPADLEVEQALLGILMYDNAAHERISVPLAAEHLYEPVHARLFATIEDHIRAGQLADPLTIAQRFQGDVAFEELGGVRYLADLVDKSPPAANATDYARVIHDLALRRELIRLSGDMSLAAVSDTETSAKDQIEIIEQQLYSLAESGASSTGFTTFPTALARALENTAEAFSRDGGLAGVSTGLHDLDRMLGGLHSSDLLILASRPSMGKSSLGLNIAFDVARKYAWEPRPDGSKKTISGGVVAFFQLEMSADQLAMRLLGEVSGVPSNLMRKGEINPSEYGRIREAALSIESAPLFIDDTGGISISQLAARSRRLKRTSGLDLIVVDYLQLVTGSSSKRNENRVQEVSEITMSLKSLAKELQVPILACAQLSRQVEQREDKRPQLSDLRESGSIEQDADVVMFIYREAYYKARLEPREGTAEHLTWQDEMEQVRNLAELIIAKQRHGPIGTVKLHFDENLTKFSDLAQPGRYQPN